MYMQNQAYQQNPMGDAIANMVLAEVNANANKNVLRNLQHRLYSEQGWNNDAFRDICRLITDVANRRGNEGYPLNNSYLRELVSEIITYSLGFIYQASADYLNNQLNPHEINEAMMLNQKYNEMVNYARGVVTPINAYQPMPNSYPQQYPNAMYNQPHMRQPPMHQPNMQPRVGYQQYVNTNVPSPFVNTNYPRNNVNTLNNNSGYVANRKSVPTTIPTPVVTTPEVVEVKPTVVTPKETIINAPFLEKDMNYEEHISRNTPLADIVAKVREMDGRTSINNSADELKFKSHREECTVNFVNTERNLVAVHETDFSISLVSALGGLNSLDSNQAFITNTFKPKIALGDFSIKAGEKNNVGFITDISGSDFKGAYEVLNDLSRMGGVSGGLWRNINDSLTKEVNYILKLGLGIDDISITNYSSDILELVDVIGDECGSIFKDAFIEYLDSSIKTIIQMPTESIYSNLRDSFLSDDTEINCSMENLPIFYSNIKTVVFAAGSHEPPFGFKLEVGEVGIIKDKYFDTFKKVLEVGNEVDSASVVTSDGLVYLVRRGIVDKGRIALLRLV